MTLINDNIYLTFKRDYFEKNTHSKMFKKYMTRESISFLSDGLVTIIVPINDIENQKR